MIIDIGNESYTVLYEKNLTDDLDSETVEKLKSRYYYRDPEKITVIKGNGKLYVCSKVEDAVFESVKKDQSSDRPGDKTPEVTKQEA